MDTQPTESSWEKIKKAPTVDGNAPGPQSKRGNRIHIGAPYKTEYPLSAVMLSKRGDKEDHSNARQKGSRDFTPPHSEISTGSSRGVSAGGFETGNDI